jgi:hypothetical protein
MSPKPSPGGGIPTTNVISEKTTNIFLTSAAETHQVDANCEGEIDQLHEDTSHRSHRSQNRYSSCCLLPLTSGYIQ